MSHSLFDQRVPQPSPVPQLPKTPQEVARRSVERVERHLHAVFEKAKRPT